MASIESSSPTTNFDLDSVNVSATCSASAHALILPFDLPPTAAQADVDAAEIILSDKFVSACSDCIASFGTLFRTLNVQSLVRSLPSLQRVVCRSEKLA